VIESENKEEYCYERLFSACGGPFIDHTKIAAFSSGRGPPSRLRRAHGLDATTCPAEALAQRGGL